MSTLAPPPRSMLPRFEPYGGARRMWYSREPTLCIHGPARTGKTFCVLKKLDGILRKYPGSRALGVRQTRASMTDTVLVTYETQVVPAGSIILEGPSRAQRRNYRYPNGSEFVLAGMDKPAKIMSGEFDVAAFFEATEGTQDAAEMISTRLRWGRWLPDGPDEPPFSQLIFDCNPGPPTHWLRRSMDKKLLEDIPSRHQDNPVMFDQVLRRWTPDGERYLARLARLTGHRLERLLKGRWVASEGLVYGSFDHDVHVINQFGSSRGKQVPPPASWRRIRVIDFGYGDPFVCQWWAIDPMGHAYLYREIYMSERTVGQHAEQILALSAGEEIEATVCDHDAEDRHTLRRAGIPNVPAIKGDIEMGLEQVRARLAKRADGTPGLYVMRDTLVEIDPNMEEHKLPLCTLEEFDCYAYPKREEGKAFKDQPVDANNHGMDCVRYLVAYLDGHPGHSKAIRVDQETTVLTSEPELTVSLALAEDAHRPTVMRRRDAASIEATEDGPWRLWTPLQDDELGTVRPPQRRTYIMGVRVSSAGNGGMHAAAVLIASETKEQVAEAVFEDAEPDELAAQLAAAGVWFGGGTAACAMMAWEANEMGIALGHMLTRLSYPWIFTYRELGERNAAPGPKMGYPALDGPRRALLASLRGSINRGRAVLRSESLVRDARRITVEDAAGSDAVDDDPDAATVGPVNRVLAAALAYHALEHVGRVKPKQREFPPGSIGYRIAQAEKGKKRKPR